MRISAKGDYACRAMLDIVLNQASDRHIQIQEIADRQDIPMKFLEQILVSLKKGGLLESRRGAGGGYFLAKSPSDISVGDVLKITDGPLMETGCPVQAAGNVHEKCPSDATGCVFKPLWQDADKALEQVFGGVSFDELARRVKANEGGMYYI